MLLRVDFVAPCLRPDLLRGALEMAYYADIL
jgi:hypothetical protein